VGLEAGERSHAERSAPAGATGESRKLAAAQEVLRMTLFENEVTAMVAMRKKGRTFSFIAEEIAICRELQARSISTSPVGFDRRTRRGPGFWRCFD
jgi:hypothetical protein